VENWSEVSGFPPKLREKLNEECPLEIKGTILQSDYGGETLKAVITLNDDGLKIESVLMCHEGDSDGKAGRNTVCVSCQIGCPMGCKFCATGAMGFRRNLTVMEIVEQVLFFDRILRKKKERVSNVVFMGMGEPFLNYNNVLAAVRILNDKDGMSIGARKISISTCGVVEGIKKLAEEKLQVNLAISLHAPDTDLRSILMPVNREYSLDEVLKAVDFYIEKTSRQVMFEYLLLKDINDTPEHAKKLASIMRKSLYFVNLILFNPSGREGMQPSSMASVKRFKEILEKAGVPVSQRYRFGRTIKAACGQLVFDA
jgi:23S rRNA (adenine2503-C2)-methyltransferase